MADVDTLMRELRAAVADLLAHAVDALDAGLSIERVQGDYIRRATDLLRDAEAQALLASEDSSAALRAIERHLEELLRLDRELADEQRQAADDEDA